METVTFAYVLPHGVPEQHRAVPKSCAAIADALTCSNLLCSTTISSLNGVLGHRYLLAV